ncbi:MAG: 50S ribosomal protein L18 [Candidatus Marinimicrobia bacterium]|nr:50S ribosomal protein L18 [Candidatus Neomarinimicrobiota bacterium]MCF7827488.1 50S ribosomal protein L18 [Candidatus Neomarinimicrobiota bacterium]MCF7882382.1 50S ribosomal protein L18 [Candidatus Neomarinimicrobiota bacterium]
MKKPSARSRKKKHVRKSIFGMPDRPRLTVFRSNANIYAQIIDDLHGNTLASSSSLENEIQEEVDKAESKAEISKIVGNQIAKKAKDAGIEKVVFDRNGYRYHGRVKALAEAVREGGLEF